MLKQLATASSMLALFALAVACSSGGTGDNTDSTDEELRTGQICGGIAGIRCPSGKTCKITAQHPDASGRCVTAKAGTEGGMCGGIANIQCQSGLECEIAEDDNSSGPPPGALGMPLPTHDAGHSSGPPPGALGLPIRSDPTGTCVTAPNRPTMGMPIHH